MHRPLPFDLDEDTEELSRNRWRARPANRRLVPFLAFACLGLVVATGVLAVRLHRSAESIPAGSSAAVPSSQLEPGAISPPGGGSERSGPAEEALASRALRPAPAGDPPVVQASTAAAPALAPPRADTRTSAQRTAAWMVVSHGRDAAVAQVRAVSRFYDGRPSELAYWRTVLDEIERLGP